MLIAADSMEAMEADSSLQVGERFAGIRVIATVQSLDDTEVHLVQDDSGSHAALKLFKTARRPAMLTFMRREAAILRRLPERSVPPPASRTGDPGVRLPAARVAVGHLR